MKWNTPVRLLYVINGTVVSNKILGQEKGPMINYIIIIIYYIIYFYD